MSKSTIPPFLQGQQGSEPQSDNPNIPPFLLKKKDKPALFGPEISSGESQPSSVIGTGETSPSKSPSPSSSPSQTVTPATPPAPKQPEETPLDRILKVAEGQMAPERPIGIQTMFQQKDPLSDNLKAIKLQKVKEGDPDTIAEVIKNQRDAIVKLKNQSETVSQYTDGSVYAAVATNKDEKYYGDIERQLVVDGARLISDSMAQRYKQSDKSAEARQQIGAKQRKLFEDIGYEDGSGEYSSDLFRIASAQKDKSKLVKPYNPSRSADADQAAAAMGGRLEESGPTNLGGSYSAQRAKNLPVYTQQYQYKNEHAVLQSVTNYNVGKLQELEKKPFIAQYLNSDEATRKKLLNDREEVRQFVDILKEVNDTVKEASQLHNKYPEIKKNIEKQMVIEAFASDQNFLESIPYFKDAKLGKNIFVGDKLDSEEEIQSVMDATGLDRETVMQYAKDASIPSFMGNVFRSTAGVLAGALQYFNRKSLSREDADVENSHIENLLYHHNKAQTLDGGYSAANIVRTMADGAGQFVGYTILTAGIGEGLGLAGRAVRLGANLVDEAAAMAGVADIEVQGLGRLLNIGKDLVGITGKTERARELAATYASGYTSSYEQGYQEAKQYSNDPNKWDQYGGATGFLNAISEMVLPDIDVAKRILAKNSVQALLKSGVLSSGKEGILKAYMAEMGKIVGSETLEEYIPLIGQTLAKANLFDSQTSRADFFKQLWDTTTQTAISTLPMAFLGLHGVNASGFSKSALFEVSKMPEKYNLMVDDLHAQGKLDTKEVDDRKQMINTLSNIHQGLPVVDVNGNRMEEHAHQDLTAAIFQQRYFSDLKAKTDASLHGVYDKKIQAATDVIEKIMSGQKVDENLTQEDIEKKKREAYLKNKTIRSDMEDAQTILDTPGLKESAPDAHNLYSERLNNPEAFYKEQLNTYTKLRNEAESAGKEGEAKEFSRMVNETQKALTHIQAVNSLYAKIKINEKNNQTSQSKNAQGQTTQSDHTESEDPEGEDVLNDAEILFGNLGRQNTNQDAATESQTQDGSQREDSRAGQHNNDTQGQQSQAEGAANTAQENSGDGLRSSAGQSQETQQIANENTQDQNGQGAAEETQLGANRSASQQPAEGQSQEQPGNEETLTPLEQNLRAARQAAGRPLTMQERLELIRKEQAAQQSQRPSSKLDKKAAAIKKKRGFATMDPGTSIVARAIKYVQENPIKGYIGQALKHAADVSPRLFRQFLRDIAEQATKYAPQETVDNYGQELVDMAIQYSRAVEDFNEQTRAVFEGWQQGLNKITREQFLSAMKGDMVQMIDYIRFVHEQGLKVSKEQIAVINAILANPNGANLLGITLKFSREVGDDTLGFIGVNKIATKEDGSHIYKLSDILLNEDLINDDRLLFDVVMHEFAHSFTIKELAENKEFRKFIEGLRLAAAKDYVPGTSEGIDYALQNDYEFVATFFNSPSFRNHLKNVKVAKQGEGNLFNRFVNWIVQKLFGGQDTAYNQLHRILTNYASNKETVDEMVITRENLGADVDAIAKTIERMDQKELVDLLKQSGVITYIDENGKPCAAAGLTSSNALKFGKWTVVKDLKGEPYHSQGGVDLSIKGQSIEAEGNELVLKHDSGNMAIIPKKDRAKVREMISENCHDCLNAYISKLPMNPEVAEDGGQYTNGGGEDPKKPVRRLTPAEMQQWNKYLDYVKAKGMQGNKALDARDKNLGSTLFEQFKRETPGVTIDYSIVPLVQNEFIQMQKSARDLEARQGRANDQLYSDISKPDSWFGSLTSQQYFPSLEVQTYRSNGKLMSVANQGLLDGNLQPTGGAGPNSNPATRRAKPNYGDVGAVELEDGTLVWKDQLPK